MGLRVVGRLYGFADGKSPIWGCFVWPHWPYQAGGIDGGVGYATLLGILLTGMPIPS